MAGLDRPLAPLLCPPDPPELVSQRTVRTAPPLLQSDIIQRHDHRLGYLGSSQTTVTQQTFSNVH